MLGFNFPENRVIKSDEIRISLLSILLLLVLVLFDTEVRLQEVAQIVPSFLALEAEYFEFVPGDYLPLIVIVIVAF